MGLAYERFIENLQGHGFKFRQEGRDRGRGQCPAHGGDDLNLAVAVGDQGVLVKCMSYDCPAEDIASGVGLALGDLFDKDGHATYDYGKHRVIRKRTRDGKRIIQQHKPQVTSLYRHPLSMPIEESDTVLVVEGEKCVDAALRMGERCVTTWPGGADAVGQVDLTPLGGKNVRIIADNDEPGLRAASRLSSRLAGLATIEGIWIVPNEKESVDDLWLRGGTFAELRSVTVQSVTEDVPARGLSLKSLSGIQSKRTRFLWEGMIPQSAVTIMAGRGGVAKSTFAIWLSGRLNRGELPGELHGSKVPVLYVSHEDSLEEVVTPRADANGVDRELFYSLGIQSKEVGGVVVPRLPEDLPIIRQAIEQTGAKLLIIDPITSALAGGDNDRMADVRLVMDPLNAMAAELGVSVIGIAHFRKGGGSQSDMISGSHAWRDAARCVVLFARDEEEDCTVITLEKINSGAAGKSFKYRLDIVQQLTDEGTLTEVGHVNWEGESSSSVGDIINHEQERTKQGGLANELLEHLRTFNGRAVKGDQIVKLFAVDGVKPDTVRRTLTRLTQRGHIVKPEYGWFMAPAPTEKLDTETSRARGGVQVVQPVQLPTELDKLDRLDDTRNGVQLCISCGFPLNERLIEAGERTHPSCDR